MSDLDPRLRPLVEAARAAGPTAEDRSRVRSALAARLALPASPPAPPHAAAGAPPAVAAPAGAAVAKLVAAGVLIGTAGFGAGLFVGKASPPVDFARHGLDVSALRRARVAERRADAPPPAPVAIVDPVVPAPVDPPAPPPAPEPVAEREPPAAPQPRSVLHRDPPPVASAAPAAEPASGKASSLVEETALLREAQTSLGAGDAAAALSRLDEMGARHPDGLLREERLAARVVALCAAGRVEEARREAARFLAETPLSIHAARVRASCASGRGDRQP